MRRFSPALLRGLLVLAVSAGTPGHLKAAAAEKVSVNQLEQSLSLVHGKSDAELAQALSSLELTERMSAVRLAHLEADLPGDKAREALVILADQSAFLPPPDDEIVADATPDAATTRQMLVKIVNYVNTTNRQLPNLMAVRETTGFEDRPKEDRLDATGTLSVSYLPIHFVAKSNVVVTYRDRKEVVDENATKALKKGASVGGLVTNGEFGPILTTVLADALKGTITWARWEQRDNAKAAVFHYAVPDQKSNYYVKFCCILNGFRSDGQPDLQLFNERAGYHGEITFDPSDGSIERITLEAEMPSTGLVPHAGIAIEYSSVEIGGKGYTCPAKSVSILQAHTAVPQGAFSRANYQGAPKTFLNDVEFRDYRRFGSETRIVDSDATPPAK
jgi:hypothetical protein